MCSRESGVPALLQHFRRARHLPSHSVGNTAFTGLQSLTKAAFACCSFCVFAVCCGRYDYFDCSHGNTLVIPTARGGGARAWAAATLSMEGDVCVEFTPTPPGHVWATPPLPPRRRPPPHYHPPPRPPFSPCLALLCAQGSPCTRRLATPSSSTRCTRRSSWTRCPSTAAATSSKAQSESVRSARCVGVHAWCVCAAVLWPPSTRPRASVCCCVSALCSRQLFF